jgi:hypothetical protein
LKSWENEREEMKLERKAVDQEMMFIIQEGRHIGPERASGSRVRQKEVCMAFSVYPRHPPPVINYFYCGPLLLERGTTTQHLRSIPF